VPRVPKVRLDQSAPSVRQEVKVQWVPVALRVRQVRRELRVRQVRRVRQAQPANSPSADHAVTKMAPPPWSEHCVGKSKGHELCSSARAEAEVRHRQTIGNHNESLNVTPVVGAEGLEPPTLSLSYKYSLRHEEIQRISCSSGNCCLATDFSGVGNQSRRTVLKVWSNHQGEVGLEDPRAHL